MGRGNAAVLVVMMMVVVVEVMLRRQGSSDHSLARRHQARLGTMVHIAGAVAPVGSEVVRHLEAGVFVSRRRSGWEQKGQAWR